MSTLMRGLQLAIIDNKTNYQIVYSYVVTIAVNHNKQLEQYENWTLNDLLTIPITPLIIVR